MLEFTPKFMLLGWALVSFTLFANYPVIAVGAVFYYMLIVPNEIYLWMLVGLGFLLFLLLESAGEHWWGPYYSMILILFLAFMGAKYGMGLDIQATLGRPLQYAMENAKGGIVMFIDFIASFFQAELQSLFTIEFIIDVVVPIYILFHICMALLVYSAVLSDRTCTFMAIAMALVGARGGVLNGLVRWVEGAIFNAASDPRTFTYFVIGGAFVLVALDAVIDILFYVMSVSPEERKEFWKSALGGEGGGKAAGAVKAVRMNPSLVKAAKLKMVDPGRIASNFAQAQRMSTLQMRQPTVMDRGFGTLRRGAFSAAPIYSSSLSTDVWKDFFTATGGGKG